MLRTLCTALAVAAIVLAPTAASAVEEYDYPPPSPPADPTLAGSLVTPECDGDVPYINYSIRLTDPDAQSTGDTATLILSSGSNSTTLVLGTLVGGQLTGRVLWPGASVDGSGAPSGWPGWAFVNGSWVETDGNFAWTRNVTSAVISVNPTLPVALSYPPSSPDCATSPPGEEPPAPGGSEPAGSSAAALSATGVSELTIAFGWGALFLAIAGGALLAVRHAVRR
ncbi:cell wall protein [Agromyces sp. CFH 90414]|uniref:Cell wall protein n=1 Tax=Agromyces agglutinans TaxID=2662258 RepID=A0A6I2FEX3_9MICO|nr:cell wall protein [Agromyces agglutinans]MRG60443.1 cell wall protein [Agromyces agglutinans]